MVEREFVVDSRPFVRALGRARYGPAGDAPPPSGSRAAELRAILGDVRRELGVRRRARGLLRLRSFAV